jgi:DNA-binding NtrC family response regulator
MVQYPGRGFATAGHLTQADLRDTSTVLVIDDEETVRRVAKSMLESYGYSVLVADDARSAVELFKEVAPRFLWWSLI